MKNRHLMSFWVIRRSSPAEQAGYEVEQGYLHSDLGWRPRWEDATLFRKKAVAEAALTILGSHLTGDFDFTIVERRARERKWVRMFNAQFEQPSNQP